MMRRLVHWLLLRPVMRWLTGINLTGQSLPATGPAIVVANHNSHVDTALLMAAFSNRAIPFARVVAAREYFCRNRLLSWFSRRVIGVIPIDRHGGREVALPPIAAALDRGMIVVMFPEGTRGEPGRLSPFRSGVAHLVTRFPDVPVIPVWLEGCDRVLPPGRSIPRRFRCVIRVGSQFGGDPRTPHDYAAALQRQVVALGRVA